MTRSLYLAAFAYAGLCGYALLTRTPAAAAPVPALAPAPAAAPVEAPHAQATSGNAWFDRVRSSCNPVEVDLRMRSDPPPGDFEGHAYQATCYALAGRIDQARTVIGQLPGEQRPGAADVLLGFADRVADEGDDTNAAPMMRLVLEFMPDAYIALFHAGMSEYALGDRAAARQHLTRFLEVYAQEDGWRARAREVLDRLGAPGAA